MRKFALSLILFGAGVGFYIHDRIAEWARLGQQIHGIDVGFTLTVISFSITAFELVKMFKKSSQ
ncbi:MAG: hypothetical protein QXM71_07530 [Thermofilum sp.]